MVINASSEISVKICYSIFIRSTSSKEIGYKSFIFLSLLRFPCLIGLVAVYLQVYSKVSAKAVRNPSKNLAQPLVFLSLALTSLILLLARVTTITHSLKSLLPYGLQSECRSALSLPWRAINDTSVPRTPTRTLSVASQPTFER